MASRSGGVKLIVAAAEGVGWPWRRGDRTRKGSRLRWRRGRLLEAAQGDRRRPTGGRQRTGSVVSELDPWGGEEAPAR
jgi:hypothetical protein